LPRTRSRSLLGKLRFSGISMIPLYRYRSDDEKMRPKQLRQPFDNGLREPEAFFFLFLFSSSICPWVSLPVSLASRGFVVFRSHYVLLSRLVIFIAAGNRTASLRTDHRRLITHRRKKQRSIDRKAPLVSPILQFIIPLFCNAESFPLAAR